MGLFFSLLLSFFSDEKIKLLEIMWFSQGHIINEWKNPILVILVHLLIQLMLFLLHHSIN